MVARLLLSNLSQVIGLTVAAAMIAPEFGAFAADPIGDWVFVPEYQLGLVLLGWTVPLYEKGMNWLLPDERLNVSSEQRTALETLRYIEANNS